MNDDKADPPEKSRSLKAEKPLSERGDPIQREARAARIKANLRENLRRRKQKARAVAQTDKPTQ